MTPFICEAKLVIKATGAGTFSWAPALYQPLIGTGSSASEGQFSEKNR
jgi:hypothetical protein